MICRLESADRGRLTDGVVSDHEVNALRTDNISRRRLMRVMKAMLWFCSRAADNGGTAHAQSTTGTISGRVVDAQALPMPG